MNRFVKLVALCALLFAVACTEKPEATSPDGRIAVRVEVDNDGAARYSVTVGDKVVIAPSLLGIITREGDFTKFKIAGLHRTSHDEEWFSPWGENKRHVNRYNELAVELSDANEVNNTLTVRFRIFDDGAAFRYELNEPDSLTVMDELTEFRFAEDGTSWSIAGNFETYELPYRELPLSAVEDANTPFTFRTESGIFCSLHEAALYDYPEMTLRRTDDGNGLISALAPLPDGVKAHISGTFTTPWRTIQICDKAVDLINSSLILNLNEPSKIEDTSWIRPQKYIGVWWGMHLGTQTWIMGPRHGATTENGVRHIDFAAANNIDGVLFEGWNCGWENWGGDQHFDYVVPYADFDLEYIASYAREKGVQLWMHNETGGNIPEYEAEMERAMKRYAELGVHTLKTGYAGGFKGGYLHHSQYGVQHYQRVVELAAKYHIMVDVHEPIKATGIRRTWPNMMTREGARGMEWNAWSEGNSSEYLCTLPFVRLLGGPMDYTPGVFDIDYSTAKADKGRLKWNGDNEHCCIKTTLARQIANWVIIYSPLQMACDLIENYDGHPAFAFFRDYDADCDLSRALQGEIGDYIVIMRRAGDRYFLGAGTNSEARTIEQPLDFLDKGKSYTATIYCDNIASSEPEDYVILSREVTADDTLTLELLPDGGAAVTFIPLQHS